MSSGNVDYALEAKEASKWKVGTAPSALQPWLLGVRGGASFALFVGAGTL